MLEVLEVQNVVAGVGNLERVEFVVPVEELDGTAWAG